MPHKPYASQFTTNSAAAHRGGLDDVESEQTQYAVMSVFGPVPPWNGNRPMVSAERWTSLIAAWTKLLGLVRTEIMSTCSGLAVCRARRAYAERLCLARTGGCSRPAWLAYSGPVYFWRLGDRHLPDAAWGYHRARGHCPRPSPTGLDR